MQLLLHGEQLRVTELFFIPDGVQLPENAFRQGKTKPSQNVGRIQRRAWKMGHSLGELFELHHVRKVKDLNGKERWEQCMIAKRRKTLVVCKPCHNAIHHGSKSQ